MAADTLPKLLKQNYEKYGTSRVAMRVKDRGIWQRYTWKDYYETVKYFSLGLVSFGLERGDKVCIIGENKPEWYWAELAAHSAGGVVLGAYADSLASEVKFYLTHSDAKFVVVEDQEQVDKLLELKDELPLIKKVIYWDPKGLWNYDDPILISFDKVIELGREYEKTHPGLFEENIERGRGDEVAVFCYTSGTTGLPKGGMLTHKNIVTLCQAWLEVDKPKEGDQFVSYVPLPWIAGQLGVAGPLFSATEVNFPEKSETVQENIREIGPTLLMFSPRIWEIVMRGVQARMLDTSPLRRFMYNLFLPVGYKMTDFHLAKKKPNWLWRALYFIAYWVVFRALRDKLGLSRVRMAYTGGAAVSPEILHYFQAIGVNIKQIYGATEPGAILTLHRDDDVKWETSGRPLPGVEIRLSNEGEILVRSDFMFLGYYKNPEATREKIRGGWYHTGDFGYVDEEGHLIVIDRMEDLKLLKGGRRFSPQYAEIRLRFNPYIKDAVVVGGEDKDYVAAIVSIDLDNVGRWADARRLPYTTVVDLSQKPEVIQLVRNEIERINKTLPEWARVKKFANLHREFDVDDAELTRTRKIRRVAIEERYHDLISALYSEATDFEVETTVTYRDGTKRNIRTPIKISSLD